MVDKNKMCLFDVGDLLSATILGLDVIGIALERIEAPFYYMNRKSFTIKILWLNRFQGEVWYNENQFRTYKMRKLNG